jgi:hypothetical protein
MWAYLRAVAKNYIKYSCIHEEPGKSVGLNINAFAEKVSTGE